VVAGADGGVVAGAAGGVVAVADGGVVAGAAGGVGVAVLAPSASRIPLAMSVFMIHVHSQAG